MDKDTEQKVILQALSEMIDMPIIKNSDPNNDENALSKLCLLGRPAQRYINSLRYLYYSYFLNIVDPFTSIFPVLVPESEWIGFHVLPKENKIKNCECSYYKANYLRIRMFKFDKNFPLTSEWGIHELLPHDWKMIPSSITCESHSDFKTITSEYKGFSNKHTLYHCKRCFTWVSNVLLIDELCVMCHNALNAICSICLQGLSEEGKSTKRSLTWDSFRCHTDCLIKPNIEKKKCSICLNPIIKKTEEICKSCESKIILEWNVKPVPIFHHLEDIKKTKEYMGIEIEAEIKPNIRNYVLRKDVAYRIYKSVNSVQPLPYDFVYFKNDGSIGERKLNDKYFGGLEIVTHPGSFEFWKSSLLVNFWDSLSRASKVIQSYASGNCGFHIHISRNSFANPIHEAVFGWFIENHQYLIAAISERPSNKRYSIVGKNSWHYIMSQSKIGDFLSPDHHCMVSYTPATIEVRCFRGNLKKERILKNIEFVHALKTWTELLVKENKFKSTNDLRKINVKDFIEFVETNNKTYEHLSSFIKTHVNELFLLTPVGVLENTNVHDTQKLKESLTQSFTFTTYATGTSATSFEQQEEGNLVELPEPEELEPFELEE